MSLKSALGLSSQSGTTSDKKIRYGMVALGDITQEAMLPGISHTGNSEVTAFVTSDVTKARELGDRYNVEHNFTYEQFDEMLDANVVDAIYIATPNFRHAEFAVRALKKGVHVLLEKPMEISTEKCREILNAQKNSKAKLMLAYRLHFEPATLSTIETIREGKIGELRLFTAVFSQMVDPANHRAAHGYLAGPLFDMGTYPVNASRYMFGEEPIEVISAVGIRSPNSQLGDLDDTVSATLRFPENRIAQFVVSYAASAIDSYSVVGTEGSIEMNPGFGFGKSLEQQIRIQGKQQHKSFKNVDQFGGEMKYFSDCILNDIDPEPNGEEGYADVRVLEAIQRAVETGQPQKLEPFVRSQRVDTEAQLQKLRATSKPPLVNAANPSIQ